MGNEAEGVKNEDNDYEYEVVEIDVNDDEEKKANTRAKVPVVPPMPRPQQSNLNVRESSRKYIPIRIEEAPRKEVMQPFFVPIREKPNPPTYKTNDMREKNLLLLNNAKLWANQKAQRQEPVLPEMSKKPVPLEPRSPIQKQEYQYVDVKPEYIHTRNYSSRPAFQPSINYSNQNDYVDQQTAKFTENTPTLKNSRIKLKKMLGTRFAVEMFEPTEKARRARSFLDKLNRRGREFTQIDIAEPEQTLTLDRMAELRNIERRRRNESSSRNKTLCTSPLNNEKGYESAPKEKITMAKYAPFILRATSKYGPPNSTTENLNDDSEITPVSFAKPTFQRSVLPHIRPRNHSFFQLCHNNTTIFII